MSADVLPKLQLTFTIPNTDEYPFTEPDHIPISSSSLVPSDAKINATVMTIIEGISRDIVFQLKKDFKENITLRITVSQNEGVVIDNERLSKLFHDNIKGVCAAVPTRLVKSAGLSHLKRVEVSDADKTRYEAQMGQPCTFFDTASLMLFQAGVKRPETVEVELSGFQGLGKGGGLTTAAFRFPHMYLDMFKRFGDKRKEDLKVCIVGPGLHRPGGKLGYCSQFVELKAMFPNARFLLLDNDASAIEYLDGQYKKMKAAAYDPLVARMLTFQFDDNPYRAPEKFQPMLAEMKAEMAACAKFPPNAKEMLDGYGGIKTMMLGVDSEKIELREFDINTSAFESGEKFDVMVATMSICLALAKGRVENMKAVMQKYIDALSINGSLYIDAALMDQILMPALDCDSPDEVMAILAERSGVKLEIDRVGLEEYLPSTVGDAGTLPNPNIAAASKDDKKIESITTHTVYVITNKGDMGDTTS